MMHCAFLHNAAVCTLLHARLCLMYCGNLIYYASYYICCLMYNVLHAVVLHYILCCLSSPVLLYISYTA